MKSPNKFWRYSSIESFYKDAVPYVDAHVSRIKSDIEKFNRDTSKKLLSMINSYEHAKELKEKGDSTLKITDKDILKLGCAIVTKDVQDWGEFSVAPDSSLQDIMIRILLGILFDFDYVCILFLCYNQNITEEFIEDTIYLTSGMFKFEEWDNKHVDAVCNCAAIGRKMNEDETLIDLYGEENLPEKQVRVVFDINGFAGRPLSKIFNNKYKRFIKIPEVQITSDW